MEPLPPLPAPGENPWTVRGQQPKYQNPWIEVTEYDVLTPAGTPGIYGKVSFRNLAIGVIPVDAEGHTWLVGQYRFPLGRYSWEIPEGGCPLDEAPLAAAQRELAEECGLQARTWRLIQQMDLSNSVSDEKGYLFLALDLQDLGYTQPEETEVLHLHHLPLQEAYARVRSGELRDSLTVCGLQALELLQLHHPSRPLHELGTPAPKGSIPLMPG